MANSICICGTGLNNTGLPLCLRLPKVIKKIIFVQLQSNAGVLNKIDPATTLNKAWVTALLNNADKYLRFFPTPEIKNIETPKDDAVFEKYNDDSSNFIRESIRKFTGLLPVTPPQYKSALESVRCNNNTGVYFIDVEGNVIGLTNYADGYLYPIPINAQSIYAKVGLADDKATTGMTLSFEFPASVDDAALWMISGSAFTDFNMNSISGLMDAKGIVSGISTTGFTLKLSVRSSAADQPIPIQGLIAANFTLAKILPSAAAVTITSVTETAPGTYVFVMPTQTTGWTLAVTPTLAGFDFSTVPALPILIP